MMPIRLRTERLTLRPWHVDEAAIMHAIRGRRDVAKWLGNGDEALSRSVAERRNAIERIAAEATIAVPRALAVVPAEVGVPVGSVLISPLVGITDGPLGAEVEIGWHLHPDAGGRGWATEAAVALLAHGLDHHARIWADMWPANEASARVAARIGMIDLGEVLDPWYGGAPHPHGRVFVTGRPGDEPALVEATARADLAAQVRDHVFPAMDDPADDVVLPGWRATAARLLAARAAPS